MHNPRDITRHSNTDCTGIGPLGVCVLPENGGNHGCIKGERRQNPDELIILILESLFKYTHIHRQTGTRGTLPCCRTCSCLSPCIPSSFCFTGNGGIKGNKGNAQTRQTEEIDEGEFQFQSPLFEVHEQTQHSGVETPPPPNILAIYIFRTAQVTRLWCKLYLKPMYNYRSALISETGNEGDLRDEPQVCWRGEHTNGTWWTGAKMHSLKKEMALQGRHQVGSGGWHWACIGNKQE